MRSYDAGSGNVFDCSPTILQDKKKEMAIAFSGEDVNLFVLILDDGDDGKEEPEAAEAEKGESEEEGAEKEEEEEEEGDGESVSLSLSL